MLKAVNGYTLSIIQGTYNFALELDYILNKVGSLSSLANAVPGIFNNPNVLPLEVHASTMPRGGISVAGIIRVLHTTEMVMRATNYADLSYIADAWLEVSRFASANLLLSATLPSLVKPMAVLNFETVPDTTTPLSGAVPTNAYGVWPSTSPLNYNYLCSFNESSGFVHINQTGTYVVFFAVKGTGLSNPHIEVGGGTEGDTLVVFQNDSTQRVTLKTVNITDAYAYIDVHCDAVTTVSQVSIAIFAGPGCKEDVYS